MNILEDKLNTFNRFFQIILILLRSDLKISSKTSSALSLIIMSMLSIFEWITRSSSLSLEEIKLIGIVNCIFHVSDNLKLFMISSSKYGLISLRYSSAYSVLFLSPLIITQKNTNFYWFIMIFFVPHAQKDFRYL